VATPSTTSTRTTQSPIRTLAKPMGSKAELGRDALTQDVHAGPFGADYADTGLYEKSANKHTGDSSGVYSTDSERRRSKSPPRHQKSRRMRSRSPLRADTYDSDHDARSKCEDNTTQSFHRQPALTTSRNSRHSIQTDATRHDDPLKWIETEKDLTGVMQYALTAQIRMIMTSIQKNVCGITRNDQFSIPPSMQPKLCQSQLNATNVRLEVLSKNLTSTNELYFSKAAHWEQSKIMVSMHRIFLAMEFFVNRWDARNVVSFNNGIARLVSVESTNPAVAKFRDNVVNLLRLIQNELTQT
jgi:hypothetical protein